jgi:hypothetical protein
VVVGRAVDVDDDIGAGVSERLGRAFRVPDVLADAHADLGAGDGEELDLIAGAEVALLIEDAVVGQELLVVDAGDLAFVEDGGGVVDVCVGVGVADDCGYAANGGGDALKSLEIIEDEGAAEEKVFGRVAGDGELWEGDDVGAGFAGAVSVVDDLGGVAVEIADYGVDLGESDS